MYSTEEVEARSTSFQKGRVNTASPLCAKARWNAQNSHESGESAAEMHPNAVTVVGSGAPEALVVLFGCEGGGVSASDAVMDTNTNQHGRP